MLDSAGQQPTHLPSPPRPNSTDPLDDENVEADDANGYDSGFDDHDGSSTASTSIRSSILERRHENGRTYHSYRAGIYALPNDEPEIDRLDLQHHLFYISFGERLYLAPAKNIHNCLDIGTGTGIWAMDFADEHPESQIIGVDLSAIQPSMVPPNLKFMIDDVEDTWHYREKFDLIHSRMMVGSVKDWPLLLSRCWDQMRPGGWIELQDVLTLTSDDNTFCLDPPSCPLAKWWASAVEAFEIMGRPMLAAKEHKSRLEAAGFVDVREMVFKWPLNTWPRDKRYKELGMWSSENTQDALEAIAMAPLTRALKWKVEEVQVLLAGARKDVRDTRIHAYWDIRVIYGRKP